MMLPAAPAVAANQQKKRSISYRPHLDGIRSFAVLAVILFHCSEPGFAYGYLGVDTFFVLSGFLITSILLVELERSGSIELWHFYARRVRRLLPAFSLMVLCTAIAYRALVVPLIIVEVKSSFYAAVFYYENFHEIAVADDYWKESADTSPLRHCWSLSVEEQFYFAFTIAIRLLLYVLNITHGQSVEKLGRERYGRLYTVFKIIVVLAIAFSLLRGMMLAEEYSPTLSYMDSISRLYQLLAGTLLALMIRSTTLRSSGALLHSGSTHSSSAMCVTANACLSALLALYLLGFVLGTVSTFLAGISSTLVSFGLIASAESARDSFAVRVLSTRALVEIGKLSYGMYLWHFPVLMLADSSSYSLWFLSTDYVHVRSIVIVLLSVVFAYASRWVIERPTMHMSLVGMKGKVWALMGIAIPLLLAVLIAFTLDVTDPQAQHQSIVLQPLIQHPHVQPMKAESEHMSVRLSPMSDGSGREVPRLTPMSVESIGETSSSDGKEYLSEETASATSVSAVNMDSARSFIYPVLPTNRSYSVSGKRGGKCITMDSRPGPSSSLTIGVTGDSHADHARFMWQYAAEQLGFRLLQCYHSGKAPFYPPPYGEVNISYFDGEGVDYIILYSFAIQKLCFSKDQCEGSKILGEPITKSRYSIEEIKEKVVGLLKGYINKLEVRKLKGLFIILPEPQSPFNVNKCIAKETQHSKCNFPVGHLEAYSLVVECYEQIAREFEQVKLINVDELFCPGGVCEGATADGQALQSDDHHPSFVKWPIVANDFFLMLQERGLEF